MASRLATAFHPRLPFWAGVCTASDAFAVDPVPHFSKSLKKSKAKGKAERRRLLLGLGASFWSQFMSMSVSGGIGGKYFMASARAKGASSSVEQVSLFGSWHFFWVLISEWTR